MALRVRHAFVSGKPTGPDASKVQGPHWDADHVITDSTTGAVLGTTGTLVPVGTVVDFAGHTPPTGWLECAGQALSTTGYAALYAALVKSSAVDITIGSPAVVTWTTGNHGLFPGSTVQFSTNGALPTGIVAATKYYVLSAGMTATTFRVSTTYEGTAIITSGTQSGTHTGVHAPYGSAPTTFNLPDFRERVTAGISAMNSAISGVLTENYAQSEVAGSPTVTLAVGNLPAHTHTVDPPATNTGNALTDHTHTFSVTGSGSGTTSAVDLSHAHTVTHEYWNNAQGSGGHAALQPDWQTNADGSFVANTSGVNLNHAHSFSVSVSASGTTSGHSANHQHAVNISTFSTGNVGSGTGFSLLQPTAFIRKIIYAGV